jgi:hypothetical protein
MSDTTFALGEKQLKLYLSEQGIDSTSIPSEAMRDVIKTACATVELTKLESSQALEMYMGLLKSNSRVIADYCTKVVQYRKASDQVICEILKAHGVLPALT